MKSLLKTEETCTISKNWKILSKADLHPVEVKAVENENMYHFDTTELE